MPDSWIRETAKTGGMIDPFVENQERDCLVMCLAKSATARRGITLAKP